jgi:hypothetical protein
MELNDDLFKSNGLRQSIKKTLCPRRGLNRQEAASYIGVSGSLFDEIFRSGEMSKSLLIKRRTVWDRHQLDEYFEALSAPDDNQWDDI